MQPDNIVSSLDNGIHSLQIDSPMVTGKPSLDAKDFPSLSKLDLGVGHPFNKDYLRQITEPFTKNETVWACTDLKIPLKYP